ncbi:hypothetical protein [Yoonia sp. MH D7]
MSGKVVELLSPDPRRVQPPLSDFWFAQLDVRLSKIEFMMARLEWQIALIVCGAFGVLILEIIKAVSAH